MTTLVILGSSVVGALGGFVVGWWMGEQEGGDFNMAPAFYAPTGAAVGAIAGAVVGSLLV